VFRGNALCPHGINANEHHANYICKHRIDYLNKEFEKCGSATRIIQIEELFKLKMISDLEINHYSETDELREEFFKTSQRIISLTDKMRKQDEGIKIQGEIDINVKQFKELVDAQAKVIEGKDIIKEAELLEDKNAPQQT